MSSEILAVLEYMEKEKSIPRANMIATITSAVKSATLKGDHQGQELDVQINPKTGALQAWVIMRVVDSVADAKTEIHIEDAKKLKENPETDIEETPELGGLIRKPIDPAYLGRIGAQTAGQAIKQGIRQFEKDRIYDDFKDQVGDIVSGVVRRRDKGNLIIEIGQVEALLPGRERVPGEEYNPGERIRCLLQKIDITPRGPELILSRADIKFVQRLFELEVTEISDGTVTVEMMAREPGYRSKLCVDTKDTKIDPVGACVGARGARVKSIVRELGGEKVDVIRYYPEPQRMLEEAMKPAVPRNIEIDEAGRRIYFEVSEEDLSIAIGRRGQNARLTSRLMGWRLDIDKLSTGEKTQEEQVGEAAARLARTLKIEDTLAERLVSVGFVSLQVFEGVTAADLEDAGFTAEEAEQIHQKATAELQTSA